MHDKALEFLRTKRTHTVVGVPYGFPGKAVIFYEPTQAECFKTLEPISKGAARAKMPIGWRP